MQEYNEAVDMLNLLVRSREDEVQTLILEKEELITKQERLKRWMSDIDQ